MRWMGTGQEGKEGWVGEREGCGVGSGGGGVRGVSEVGG